MSSGFCIECGLRVASFDGLNCCPHCKTDAIPCGDENQISASINWQELRVLCMWAEKWAIDIGETTTVYSIAQRLEKQFPKRGRLTLAGEIDELKDIYGRDNVETNFPGVE